MVVPVGGSPEGLQRRDVLRFGDMRLLTFQE
jgi:hypothetical protein